MCPIYLSTNMQKLIDKSERLIDYLMYRIITSRQSYVLRWEKERKLMCSIMY